MNRRTWFSSVVATVLGWLGWESPIHEFDRTLEGERLEGTWQPHQMVVNPNPVHIYCLEPPHVRLYNIYIKEVCAFLDIANRQHGGIEPDERLMRTVECAIDIPEQAVYDFRNDLMSKIGVRHWQGQKSLWDFHPRLKEAIEKVAANWQEIPYVALNPEIGLPNVSKEKPEYIHWQWGADYEELSR
jgi:hypothetical protein